MKKREFEEEMFRMILEKIQQKNLDSDSLYPDQKCSFSDLEEFWKDKEAPALYFYGSNSLDSMQSSFYKYFSGALKKRKTVEQKDVKPYIEYHVEKIMQGVRKNGRVSLWKDALDEIALVASLYGINPCFLEEDIHFLQLLVRSSLLKQTDKKYACEWIPMNEPVTFRDKQLTRGGFFLGSQFEFPSNRLDRKNYQLLVHGTKHSKFFGPCLDSTFVKKEPRDGISSPHSFPFSTFLEMTFSAQQEYISFLAGEIGPETVSAELLMYYLSGIELHFLAYPLVSDQEDARKTTAFLGSLLKIERFDPDWKNVLSRVRQLAGAIFIFHLPDDNPEDYGFSMAESSLLSTYKLSKTFDLESFRDLTLEDMDKIFEIYGIDEMFADFNVDLRKYIFANITRFGFRIDPYSIVHSPKYYGGIESFRSCYSDVECTMLKSRKIEITEFGTQLHLAIQRQIRNIEEDLRPARGIRNKKFAPLFLPPYIDTLSEENTDDAVKEIFGESEENFKIMSLRELGNLLGNDRSEEIDFYWYGAKWDSAFNRAGMFIAPIPNYDDIPVSPDMNVVIGRADMEILKKNKAYTRNLKAIVLARLTGILLYGTKYGSREFEISDRMMESIRLSKRNVLHWKAMARWYVGKKQVLSAKLKRLTKEKFMSDDDKEKLYEYIVSLLWNGESVDPKRMKAAQKIFQLLEIDSSHVHSDIHRLLTRKTGTAPQKNSSKGSAKSLDKALLKEVEKDTKQAQSTLAKIFSEENKEETPREIPEETPWKDAARAPFMEILDSLLSKEEWPREEVETMCREKGLLPNTVLEDINEYAYETFGDALIEDDGDTVTIFRDVMRD